MSIERGFETAGKFAYELLGKRGVKEISADQIDAILAHVMVGQNDNRCSGILLHRAARSDLEELREGNFIYY